MKPHADMSRTELLQELTKKEAAAAETLRRVEGHYRDLFANMNIACAQHEILCDGYGKPHDYRFLYVNRLFEEETGIKAADVEGRTVRQLFPDLDKWWIETYGKVALTGESTRFENYDSNTQRHYEVFAFSPEPDKFSVLVKNITEQKRTEEALRESAAHYRAMMAGFDGLMYVCSPDYRIESHNETMQRRIGHDATGEYCYSALHGLDAVCPWCVNDRVLAGESVRWVIKSPKDKRWYEVSNTPIQKGDGTISKQALMVDITERKEMEEALILNQRDLKLANDLLEQRVRERTADLEAAIRVQESFSYSVSHDLRAPLRHMNSFSALLIEDHGEALPSQARDYLDRIRAASSKMGSLIDHLLELSRVTRAELKVEPVDLSELADSTLRMFQETDPDRCVEQIVEQGIKVMGDGSLLRQLLENLLGNAWKYTSKKPFGCIQFGKALVSGQEAYFVKDNGAGFDMAYQKKLFRVFERLHGSEFEGIGIGLATAQRIIQRHGGKIWSEGKIGKGATFYFTLPVYF